MLSEQDRTLIMVASLGLAMFALSLAMKIARVVMMENEFLQAENRALHNSMARFVVVEPETRGTGWTGREKGWPESQPSPEATREAD